MLSFVDYQFEDSSAFLDDSQKLRTKMHENGYLFFKNLIPRRVVEKTRNDIIEILRNHGYIDETAFPVPKWSRKEEEVDGAICELQASGAVGRQIGGLDSVQALYLSREIMNVFHAILGGVVYPWVLNSDRVKVKLPGRDTYIHQDTAYYSLSVRGRAVPFYVAWVPLMDIGESEGGLVLERGSHHQYLQVFGKPSRNSLLPNSWCNFELLGMPSNKEQFQQWLNSGAFVLHGDVLSFNQERAWSGSDYHPGDVLIFHRRTVHRALVNTSDLIRLSADFRYQRKGTPSDFRSGQRQVTVDQFCATVRQHLTQMGLGRGILADRIIGLLLVEGPKTSNGSGIGGRVQELVKCLQRNGGDEFYLPVTPPEDA